MFVWHPSDPPLTIEQHSKAKLTVLHSYLHDYFDRLGTIPSRDEFRLDLIDGFAGGGTFLDRGEILSGTPLIMLEETRAAQDRLNQNRTKLLRFDCKFHFVDINPNHTAHLRRVLDERGYQVDGEEIVVHTGAFEDVADSIIADISHRQPRAGRSIFLLDQTGFSQVELALVSRILGRLPTAEVIMTFAADILTNFLAERPEIVRAVSPLGWTDSDIRDFIQLRNGDGGRALVQRALRDRIRNATGATYDTPFFIRPHQSRRALWFLHLSRHPTARDVMIQCHWKNFNTFEHYGSGNFGMLGWDALSNYAEALPLFNFGDLDAEQLRQQLLASMPTELYALASDTPITVETMRNMLANSTAARFSDLDKTVLELAREREFDILNSNGRLRSRKLTRLEPTDRIAIPLTRLFPGFSRLT